MNSMGATVGELLTLINPLSSSEFSSFHITSSSLRKLLYRGPQSMSSVDSSLFLTSLILWSMFFPQSGGNHLAHFQSNTSRYSLYCSGSFSRGSLYNLGFKAFSILAKLAKKTLISSLLPCFVQDLCCHSTHNQNAEAKIWHKPTFGSTNGISTLWSLNSKDGFLGNMIVLLSFSQRVPRITL